MYREKFDVAIARAVAEMRVLGIFVTSSSMLVLETKLLISGQSESKLFVMNFSAEYCLPLVRIGGLVVAAKGHDPKVRVLICDILFLIYVYEALVNSASVT